MNIKTIKIANIPTTVWGQNSEKYIFMFTEKCLVKNMQNRLQK